MNKETIKVNNAKLYNYTSDADNITASFYVYDFDNSKLVFKIGDEGIEPSQIKYVELVKRSDTKINIEVLDNGWVVRSKSKNVICKTMTDVRDEIEEISIEQIHHTIDYDPNVHKFENLDEIIAEISENLPTA
jgi:hypothetical protein